MSTCLTAASPFYAVSISPTDAQVSRLMRESHVLGLDDPVTLRPDNTR